MKFRHHRGSLAESMKTLVELDGRETLVNYLQKHFDLWFTFKPEQLKVEPYGSGGDKRIGWKQTYLVTIEGFGVAGFADSPC